MDWKYLGDHFVCNHKDLLPSVIKTSEYMPPHSSNCNICGDNMMKLTMFQRQFHLLTMHADRLKTDEENLEPPGKLILIKKQVSDHSLISTIAVFPSNGFKLLQLEFSIMQPLLD